MSHTCTYHSTTLDIHPMFAVTSVTFFFVADVKCSLYEINRNNRVNATRGSSPVQKLFRNRNKAWLDQRRPRLGLVPILKLIIRQDVKGKSACPRRKHKSAVLMEKNGISVWPSASLTQAKPTIMD